jgi:Zn-dependent protease
VQALDFSVLLNNISIYAIPALFAITLHEVAHGWTARYFGDRTAEMLGRLSLNPLRHIDPIGTVAVPVLLLAVGAPLFGWAKAVPVATSALRNPRAAMIMVALAGPAANILMALIWCGVLAAIVPIHGNTALNYWVGNMAQAGIWLNVILAVFNLLPIPPLDGGRVLAGVLPPQLSARLEKVEPAGLFIVIGLSVFGLFAWLFNPVYHVVQRIIHELLKSSA